MQAETFDPGLTDDSHATCLTFHFLMWCFYVHLTDAQLDIIFPGIQYMFHTIQNNSFCHRCYSHLKAHLHRRFLSGNSTSFLQRATCIRLQISSKLGQFHAEIIAGGLYTRYWTFSWESDDNCVQSHPWFFCFLPFFFVLLFIASRVFLLIWSQFYSSPKVTSFMVTEPFKIAWSKHLRRLGSLVSKRSKCCRVIQLFNQELL